MDKGKVRYKKTTSDFIEECLTCNRVHRLSYSGDIRRMNMALIVSADRLKKIKRLFDTKKVEDIYVYEYSEFFNPNKIYRCIELDRILKIKRIFGL